MLVGATLLFTTNAYLILVNGWFRSFDAIPASGLSISDVDQILTKNLGQFFIAGVEVAMFFRETSDHRVRVSIRSKGAVNVSTVAAAFGGGGHECASGFSLNGSVSSAIERVVAELRARLG